MIMMRWSIIVENCSYRANTQNITPAVKVHFFLLQSCNKYIFWSLLAYFTISSELIEIVIAEGRNIMNRLTTESLVAVLIYNNCSVTTL